MNKILVTCPPMLRAMGRWERQFQDSELEFTTPILVQNLTVAELIDILPAHDGWIIGDDPVTREVLEAGRLGKFRAAVKWGVGTDNVDAVACRDLGIPWANTPDMFGPEVADVATGYVIGLARNLFAIDRQVRAGGWPKPTGISLAGKHVALLGYGNIGQAVAKRLISLEMRVIAYDPRSQSAPFCSGVEWAEWPIRIEEADFIVLTAALNPTTFHLVDEAVLARAKRGVRVVNVARGPIIDEAALVQCLVSGQVGGAALDVFEVEPLLPSSPLRDQPHVVFGSHNASNTAEAVERTSETALRKLFDLLRIPWTQP